MASVKRFHIAIKAVIVSDGKALVLKDAKRFRGWDLPGGKIDKGEGIEQALKRELDEELGLKTFSKEDLLFAYERQDYKKEGMSIILLFYKVEAKIQKIQLSDEHAEYMWISKNDFKKMVGKNEFRNDGVKVALEKVLK